MGSNYNKYDIKDGCDAGDVWSRDSSDDKETGEAARSSRNENVFSLGMTRKDKIRNEHIRGT